ncbi:MAG: NAD(+)/NADH kinase [Planctomycetota bacterium]|jgi:NAD+ kinase
MSEKPEDCSDTPPIRAILLGFGGRPDVLAGAERLRPVIEQHAQIVASDFDFSQDLSEVEADVAIVLGGDGSILRAAHQMGRRQLPVIAVNLGRLGFLADLSPDELPDVLRDFRAGRLPLVEHLMFDCRVLRDERVHCRHLGLNEVAVQAGPPFAIMDVDLYVDSELVTTYSCDGLIVSTPVGSTAHSLSAGGPILRKDLQAFVVLPISPHTLTNRPVVDSSERVYELAVAEPNAGTSVVVDGRVICTLKHGDRVRVAAAAPRFTLVAAPGHSYYRTLREKLGWGGRLHLNDGT